MGKKTLVVVACLLLNVAAFPQDKPVSIVGTWKLNVEKSNLSNLPSKPKSIVVHITEDEPTTLKFNYTEVTADGKTDNATYSGAYDGQQHPLTGSATYKSIAYTRKSNTTSHGEWTLTRGGTATQDNSVSDDGKTLTCEFKQGDTSWTDVFERVGAGHTKAVAKTAASGK